MGHHISAIIGSKDIDVDKLKEFGLAAAFESDLILIILDSDATEILGEILDKSVESISDKIEWECELTCYIANVIGLRSFAIIETNYFGGIGEQAASYFENGTKTLDNVDINEALAKLGVNRKGDLDEFDSINLGDYRASYYYYWDEDNQALLKDNMIPGKVLSVNAKRR